MPWKNIYSSERDEFLEFPEGGIIELDELSGSDSEFNITDINYNFPQSQVSWRISIDC